MRGAVDAAEQVLLSVQFLIDVRQDRSAGTDAVGVIGRAAGIRSRRKFAR